MKRKDYSEEDFKWINEYNKTHNDEYKNFIVHDKYLAIYKPEHHKSQSDGYVYIHQLQAEKILGRKLKGEECVHHKDENKFNNDENNLIVFKTKSDHGAFHGGADIYLEDDVWVAKITNIICPKCGGIKNKRAKICKKCSSLETKEKMTRKDLPERDILLKLIINNSFVSIGKMYGVSDNAVRKWCKNYNLPFRKSDIKRLLENKNNIQ